MSTFVAVGHIIGTCFTQVATTIGAHGFIAAIPHIGNIAVATAGWLASGTAGITTLVTGATAAVVACVM